MRRVMQATNCVLISVGQLGPQTAKVTKEIDVHRRLNRSGRRKNNVNCFMGRTVKLNPVLPRRDFAENDPSVFSQLLSCNRTFLFAPERHQSLVHGLLVKGEQDFKVMVGQLEWRLPILEAGQEGS